MSRIRTVLCLGVVALLATACGGDSSSEGDGFNSADVMFAQMMIPHHEQAIELSDIALDPTVESGAEVQKLAQQIKQGQDPEIAVMTALLTEWGQSLVMDNSSDHSEMMSGMLTLDDLTSLAELRGGEFDQAWMAAMIDHHEGAIEMADDVIADGSNPEALALAKAIITAQQSEIAEMETLLG